MPRRTAAPAADGFPDGAFDPMKTSHIPLRVPFYADKIARRQRRLDQYLTRADAHTFVLKQFHQHAMHVGTFVLMGLLALGGLTLLSDGPIGALQVLGAQLLWAVPVSGALYGAGRLLLVPPASPE